MRRFTIVCGFIVAAIGVPSCSVIADTDAAQCNNDIDCTSRGPSFDRYACNTQTHVCAPPGEAIKCTSTEQCTRINGGKPSLCPVVGQACQVVVPNEADHPCNRVIGGNNKDNLNWAAPEGAIFIGAMVDTPTELSSEADLAKEMAQLQALALKDFTTQYAAGINGADGKSHPIAMVVCDVGSGYIGGPDFTAKVRKAADHLVNTLRVPSIQTMNDSATEIVLQEYTKKNGNTPFVFGTLDSYYHSYSSTPENDLYLAVESPAVQPEMAKPVIAMAAAREADLRAQGRTGQLKMALVAMNVPESIKAAEVEARDLRINGKPVGENGANFKRFDFSDVAEATDLAKQVVAYEPDIIVYGTQEGGAFAVFPAIESTWTSQKKPYHVLTPYAFLPTLIPLVSAEQRTRVTTMWVAGDKGFELGTYQTAYDNYQREYGEGFSVGLFNDSLWLNIYALAAASANNMALDGKAIQYGLTKLSSGQVYQSIPADVNSIMSELKKGSAIDLTGPSTDMNIDPTTRQIVDDFTAVCVDTSPTSPTGFTWPAGDWRWNHTTNTFTGKIDCP